MQDKYFICFVIWTLGRYFLYIKRYYYKLAQTQRQPRRFVYTNIDTTYCVVHPCQPTGKIYSSSTINNTQYSHRTYTQTHAHTSILAAWIASNSSSVRLPIYVDDERTYTIHTGMLIHTHTITFIPVSVSFCTQKPILGETSSVKVEYSSSHRIRITRIQCIGRTSLHLTFHIAVSRLPGCD